MYIIGHGEMSDPKRLALQTKQYWDIPNAPGPPRPPEAMKSAYKLLKERFHSLVLRSQRSDYDCMGLVFGSRRTFIDIEHAPRILHQDGYRRIDVTETARGDVILYEDEDGPAHIGIMWSYEPDLKVRTVLSQWGADGEFFHRIDDVRDDWKHRVSAWTERVNYQ